MATKEKNEAVRAELRKTLAELETLRDELRVRTHLAGMDLKSAWDRLDPEYLRLRDAAREAKDDALVSLRDGLVAVRKGLHALRVRLDSTDGA